MYFYSKKSSKKILHTKGCSHIKNVAPEHMGSFKTLEEAYEQGYRLCRHCSIIAQQYRKESDSLVEYGHAHAVSFFFNDRFIGVRTPYSQWKIVPSTNGKQMMLYHRNTFKTEKDADSPVKNYHHQKVAKDSIYGYLEYIVEHEYYRMMHPVEIFHPKKNSTPPQKGTKRYKKQQKMLKRIERKRSIVNVLNILDSLQEQQQSAYAM